MGIKLSALTVYTADLEKTKQFYEALGLKLHKWQSDWSENYYYFEKLENDLYFNVVLCDPENIIKNDNAFGRAMEFSVENVVETIKKLTALGMPILAPHPVIRHNCERATVQDPDGRPIKLKNKILWKPA